MNASEITSLEERLHPSLTGAPLSTLPSPELMVTYQARVRHQRNEYMAGLVVRLARWFFARLGGWVWEVRQIAVSCTAARLHLPAAKLDLT